MFYLCGTLREMKELRFHTNKNYFVYLFSCRDMLDIHFYVSKGQEYIQQSVRRINMITNVSLDNMAAWQHDPTEQQGTKN